ncbi:protein translocase subunit SecD [bacterium]|nr:protein translocase subunit SecD [bacterium]
MDCSFLTNIAFQCLTLAQTEVPVVQTNWLDGVWLGVPMRSLIALVVVLAVLILPFVVGHFLSKLLRMPSFATRLGWVLLAITASVVVLANKLPGLGVDLSGGTILVYELNPKKLKDLADQGGQRVISEDLIEPLTRRINPSGTQEIVLRPYGEKQIEIIVPEVDQLEVDRIKGLVEEAGVLRFAIVANTQQHQRQIEAAKKQASEGRLQATRSSVEDEAGAQMAIWASVDREKKGIEGKVDPFRVDVSRGTLRDGKTGAIVTPQRGIDPQALADWDAQALADWAEQEGINNLEVLMIYNASLDVTGSDLAFAASTFDQNGAPAVAFTLTDVGSGKFFALTTNNSPRGNVQSQLGIVLDDSLLSAPNILQPIRKDGRITGNFTREEVDSLVQILKAGQLPAALTKQPIAENQIDATLGKDTIDKGVNAILTSLALVLVFILVYYRFAGFVACVALVMNLGMILGTMVLINQPLTLPGLAGLVLTVGMSVDANVLIFERIREELKKGAAGRMAVRNGFAKATVTIVDANLTTLITAFVLYAIGTDQIRGFAVTLILGILFSMFTAIYVSRTLFDIFERRGKLSLSMADTVNRIRASFSGENGLDFVSKGKLTLAVSGILIVVGVASLFTRGKGIFDIDFAGGSSVQFRVSEATETEEIRVVISDYISAQSEEAKTKEAEAKELENGQAGEVSKLDQPRYDELMAEAEACRKRASIGSSFTVNGVSVNGVTEQTVYKVDTSQEQVNDLKQLVAKAFEGSPIKLVTYSVTIKDPKSDSDKQSSWRPHADESFGNGVMLIAAPVQDEAAEPAKGPEGEKSPSPVAQDGVNETAEPAAATDDTTAAATDDTTAAATDDTTAAATDDPAPAATDDPAPAATLSAEVKPRDDSPSEVETAKVITLGIGGGVETAKANRSTLEEKVIAAALSIDINLTDANINLTPQFEDGTEAWEADSELPFASWDVVLSLPAAETEAVMTALANEMGGEPVWISSSSVGSRVAEDMIGRAFGALFASLLCIIAYIWFRFQRVIYGFAAVAALLHDVLITLGAIAVSAYVAEYLGFLQIDEFKISLTVVAAILTIIGYSLNDTIVVFDRIRETKGKAPKLTGDMINVSINQTLSRTLLTSLTTLIVVMLLYWFGGEGIHAFAFALVVGVIAGTYSSIFIASPILLFLIERGDKRKVA